MKSLITMLLALTLCFSVQAADQVKQAKPELVTLSADNTLHLSDSFNSQAVTELMQKATAMDANLKSGYPIFVVLYTPGGSIQLGLELFEFLKGLNRPVHTITIFAASMGFQMVQHMGDRIIMKYGVLMSHKARGAFSGEFGGGISQLDSRYQLWLRRITLMDQQTVDRTKGKQTMKTYTDAYTPELWLNGEEAVEKGYADKVATVRCDISLTGEREETFDFGFFKIIAVFSKCPLKTRPLDIKVAILTNKGEMPLKEFLQKNGKFGKECREYERTYYSKTSGVYSSSYTDDEEKKTEEAELCAKDKELTLEKITKAKEEKFKYLTRNLRDHIEYSY